MQHIVVDVLRNSLNANTPVRRHLKKYLRVCGGPLGCKKAF